MSGVHISGGASILVANGVAVASHCSTFIALVFDDRHVFSPSTTARHARGFTRDASSTPWYACCRARRSFELAFTSRGTCLEIAKVDSDAEETLRVEEKRRIY